MSVIAVFHGSFCLEEQILERLASSTGRRLLRDEDVVARASGIAALTDKKLRRTFTSKASVFNRFTHEKEQSVAGLRLAVAELLSETDDLLLAGFSTRLIPAEIGHVLKVCLIAGPRFRVAKAEEAGLSSKEASAQVQQNLQDAGAWFASLGEKREPWDAALYDIVIPTDTTSVDEAVRLIEENAGKPVVQATEASRQASADFHLGAKVGLALAKQGHNVDVKASGGAVQITINNKVLMLNRLEEELRSISSGVEGVESVETKVGPGFHQADVYRQCRFEMPAKVLLVDDEREFVQTLSERLLMREVGSAVAYDGRSALELVNEDEPDVMILDLKMPGIDGIEVLRRVKATNPDVEVIILTGHGSEADRKVCMELGAYAYLQKPVDIKVLTKILGEANEAVQRKRDREG